MTDSLGSMRARGYVRTHRTCVCLVIERDLLIARRPDLLTPCTRQRRRKPIRAKSRPAGHEREFFFLKSKEMFVFGVENSALGRNNYYLPVFARKLTRDATICHHASPTCQLAARCCEKRDIDPVHRARDSNDGEWYMYIDSTIIYGEVYI